MNTRFLCFPARSLRRLLPLALVATALVTTLVAAPAPRAEKKNSDRSESPAEMWVENLPASKKLMPAPRAQSVPAFAGPTRPLSPSVAQSFWRPIGPTALNGQTSNRVDPVSGRTTVMAINPTNAEIVYAGSAQGGVWRSLNGGASWTQLMDNAAGGTAGTPLAIGSLVLSPSDPSTLFVGTGEGNLSGDSFFGSGFYIITNAGSFNPIVSGPFNAQAGDGADIFTGRSIVAIAVDPTNSNNVFVSTSSGIGGIRSTAFSVLPNRGVYRSTNALSVTPTWTRLQVTGTTSLNTISTSLVMDPANPNTIVAAFLGQAAGDPAGIYRTTNALAATPTWTLSKVNPLGATTGNCKLALSRVGGSVTVYATTGEGNGSLFKSTDGGATFGAAIASVTGFAGGQSFYDIAVGVDPTNPNNVSVGGNTGNNIYRYSRDGGATSFLSSVTGLHADVHWIGYAPSNPNVIYHLNDGGIWRSNDAGLSWTSLNNGTLNTFQYSGIALHPTDRNFTLAGTQDNGTHMIRPDASSFRVDFGDGGFSSIDQSAADTTTVTMYHTYFNQANSLIGSGRNLTVPCAVEANWSFHGIYGGVVDPTVYCDGTSDSFNGILLTDATNFYAPMALGPGNPNTWYFGSDKLYRSADRANTGVAASQLLQSGVPVSSIAVSPQDDNYRLVGLNNGKVFATTSGAAVLLQIAGTGATNGTATTPAVAAGRIAIDPNNKNVAYLAFGGFGTTGTPIAHIWKTTNLNVLPAGSVVFTPMSTGLPDLPANAIAIDPQSGTGIADSTDIYVGTDRGVYASFDGGVTWSVYGTGFPRVSVFGLEIQNPSRIIRAATHGRGMFETFVAHQPAVPQLSQVVSRKTHGAAGTFDINMPLSGPSGIEDRLGNPAGSHTIVLTFTNTVTAGTATSSAGSVSNVSFDGTDMIVTLTGINDVQTVTVTANNVTNGPTGTLPSITANIGFLQGDANGDRSVNSTDVSLTKSLSGALVEGGNFRNDVNANGAINSTDVSIVKSRSGNVLP